LTDIDLGGGHVDRHPAQLQRRTIDSTVLDCTRVGHPRSSGCLADSRWIAKRLSRLSSFLFCLHWQCKFAARSWTRSATWSRRASSSDARPGAPPVPHRGRPPGAHRHGDRPPGGEGRRGSRPPGRGFGARKKKINGRTVTLAWADGGVRAQAAALGADKPEADRGSGRTHRRAHLRGAAPPLGGRADPRLDHPLPAHRPRLRTAQRASRRHGPLVHDRHHDPAAGPPPASDRARPTSPAIGPPAGP
jgi:hypothetical protein